MGGGSIAEVEHLALFNQRANPIHLPPLRHLRAYALYHLSAPVFGQHFGDDRRASRRQFVQRRYVQVGVIAHGQGARYGRSRHHQQMRLHGFVLQFAAQRQTLGHAKAVLLVDHRQRQIFEMHLGLDDGVGAHYQLGLAVFNNFQHGAPLFGLLRAGQPGGSNAQGLQPSQQFAEMLLGQYFGGRHQRALPACVDADRCRQRSDYGLSGAYISLQ